MSSDGFPAWTLAPLPVLLLAIAIAPVLSPRWWERPWFHVVVVAACSAPIVAYMLFTHRHREAIGAAAAYAELVATLGALYVTASGIAVTGSTGGTPRGNVAFLVAGAALASVVGTTGASLLMIRPFLRANRRRARRGHLAPFFILVVANAGGLLTPLGDPPLLVGYARGVPFFWTLRLFPIWLIYVGSIAAIFYAVDRRSWAHESTPARDEGAPLRVRGWRNVALLLSVAPAALLPAGGREAAMVAIACVSIAITPRELRDTTGFGFAPIVEVAILFGGIFACLAPVESVLRDAAPSLPLHAGWQIFWASGLLSSVLDNAPTYAAFSALARGASHGVGLVAGIDPVKLAAVSVGCVVMGATTYVGNAPNWMIKSIAEREKFPMPSFIRYAGIAFAVMLPAHVATTIALALLDR